MNATEIAATLSVRAPDICRSYLPRGRKRGRYWTADDTNGAKGRSLFVRLAFQAYPRNGPAPRPTSMDICSISSVCAPAEHRCAAPWRRPSRSSRCRRPLPTMTAAAEGVQRSWLDPKRPTKANLVSPAQSTWACPRQGRTPRRVRLLARPCLPERASKPCCHWSTAVPGIHATVALSAGSLGAFEPPQDLASVGHRPR